MNVLKKLRADINTSIVPILYQRDNLGRYYRDGKSFLRKIVKTKIFGFKLMILNYLRLFFGLDRGRCSTPIPAESLGMSCINKGDRRLFSVKRIRTRGTPFHSKVAKNIAWKIYKTSANST